MIENLSALSGVAYEKFGAIFPSFVAPTPAPMRAADQKTIRRQERKEVRRPAGSSLLAKPDSRLQQLAPLSLTTNVCNKSGNLLFRSKLGGPVCSEAHCDWNVSFNPEAVFEAVAAA
jgi:hypothetical protein